MTHSVRLALITPIIVICFSSCFIRGMVFDNRFLPLMQRPAVPRPCQPTRIFTDAVFITADQSFNTIQEQIPLPEIFGQFDLGSYGNTLDAASLANPIRQQRPVWVGKDIPFILDGKLQAQGLSAAYQQEITPWLSVGVWGLILRARSRWEYELVFGSTADRTRTIIPLEEQGNLLEIDQLRREILQELGLSCGLADQFGPGDTELYVRFVQDWDYAWKFRHIQLAWYVGALLATGVKRDINNPASIPFGGNGHNGWFLAGLSYFEIKEDFWFRLYLRVSDRMAKDQVERLPVGREPQPLGVIKANVRINPGPTFILSPYFMFEALRDGLGFGIGYYLIYHSPDTWTDLRAQEEQEETPVFIKPDPSRPGRSIEERSKWGRDYVSLLAFYDRGINDPETVGPVISMTWDVPTGWFVANRSYVAHRVTLGLQVNF